MPATSPRLKTRYKCQWREVVAMNFEVDPRVIRRHLPEQLSIDHYNDHTLVTMMAKRVRRFRPWGLPPGLFRGFEQIDFRTYVSCDSGGQTLRGHYVLRSFVSSKMAGGLLKFLTGQPQELISAKRVTSGFEEARRDALPSADYRWNFGDSESHFMVKARQVASKGEAGSKEEFVLQQNRRIQITSDGIQVHEIRQTPWLVWNASSGSFDCNIRSLLGDEFQRYLGQPNFVLLSQGGEVTVFKGQNPG